MIPVRIEEDKDQLYFVVNFSYESYGMIDRWLCSLPMTHRQSKIYNQFQTETDIVIQKDFKREDFAKIVLMIIGTIICIFLGPDSQIQILLI